jgi:hypothetical protein
MPIAEKSPDSDQELRWRTWEEKGRRADRLAEKRMRVLFSIVGLILLTWIVFYALRTKASRTPDRERNLSGLTTL